MNLAHLSLSRDRQSYYEQLRAAGVPEDQARRDEWANDLLRLRNRDAYMAQSESEQEAA
jgi:predicted ArsR family transcriptional regulator